MVSVYTYNLLSTRLSDASFHNRCFPKYLDTEYRWELIHERLSSQMKKNSVICLQELSEEWIMKLMGLFLQNEYVFIYDSAWLGVGIAYPSSLYSFKGMSMIAVGEHLQKECKRAPKTTQSLIPYGLSHAWRYIQSWFITPKQEEDPWEGAIRAKNRLIGVSLSDKTGHCFKVFTYHMPCLFRNPNLMNIQAAALLTTVQKEAQDHAYVLAGDFNSTPDSEVYRMITKGRCVFPRSTSFMTTPDFKLDIMQSAYDSVNSCEPAYTNFSHTCRSVAPFRDTIDYIFFSGMTCTQVMATREDRSTATFPNAEEPSDHLPLCATFSIK